MIMKYRLIMLCFVMLMFLSQGCLSQIASVNKTAPEWIGSQITVRQNLVLRSGSYASKIGWQEKTYKLDNGNWVYVEPALPDCFIHWEVNPEGIIVGYKTEGKRCY